jgi:hypothetical protein
MPATQRQTMAQVKYGDNTDCATTPCNAATPTVDVIYNGTGSGDKHRPGLQQMTTPAPGTAASEQLDRRVELSITRPVPGAANTSPAIIDPLWSIDCGAHTCINCHTSNHPNRDVQYPADDPIAVTYGRGLLGQPRS